MESPRAALNVQRGLALVLLLVSLGVAAVERSAPLASRLRSLQPWPFWLSVSETGHGIRSTFYLGIYHPLPRRLVLIRIPETAKLDGSLTVARAYSDVLHVTGNADSAVRAVEDLTQQKISDLSLEAISWEGIGHLDLKISAEEQPEPAVAVALAIKAQGRSLRALWSLLHRCVAGLMKGDKAAFDALLLILELRSVPLDGLAPALLPEDADAPVFLAGAFAAQFEPRNNEKAIVVEILNGTSIRGLAAQATKVLRLKGLDVVSIGRTPHPRLQTAIYDRTGDFERAARTRVALGCRSAFAATRIDAMRGVDVSVELGDDCVFKEKTWSSSEY